MPSFKSIKKANTFQYNWLKNTLKAIQNVSLDRVRAYRVLRFANIVIDKPKQEKFWVGWFRRATEV